jgi:hypothetical protein
MEWISQFKPPLGAPKDLSHWANSGLVGEWLFNEGTGKIVNDSSGNNNTGTCVGMNDPPISISGWNAGPHGGALAFDGSNDYVTVLDNDALSSIENGGTYILWIQPAVDLRRGSFTGMLDTKPAAVGALQLQVVSSNKLRNSLGGEVGAEWLIDSNWANQTHFIAGTWTKKTSPLQILYIDGVSKAQFQSGRTVAVDLLDIGRLNALYYFPGLISSVSIYNRALSAEEIAYLYAFPWCGFDASEFESWQYDGANYLAQLSHYYNQMRAA